MIKTAIKAGVIGCGNISLTYIPNICQHYKNVEIVAVANRHRETAEKAAAANNIAKVYEIDELLADPEIEIVINLTIPAAHYEINKKILMAGKHVYCEKPIATSLEDANELVELANSKGLYCVAAPDTILGAGIQTVRKLLDDGKIGRVTGFTANFWQHGSELWHPAPHFLYQKGAGPMLDMGPYYVQTLVSLLGPIDEILCYCSCPTPKRMIQGKLFDVEIDTSYVAILKFRNGITGTLTASYDIWYSTLPHFEFYGDDGVIIGPDPNMFRGPVYIYDGLGLERRVKGEEGFFNKARAMYGPGKIDFLKEVKMQHAVEMETPQGNMRGLGVSDLASALLHNRKPRLSAELSRHVMEALLGCKISSDTRRPYKMTSSCERPAAVPAGLECWAID